MKVSKGMIAVSSVLTGVKGDSDWLVTRVVEFSGRGLPVEVRWEKSSRGAGVVLFRGLASDERVATCRKCQRPWLHHRSQGRQCLELRYKRPDR